MNFNSKPAFVPRSSTLSQENSQATLKSTVRLPDSDEPRVLLDPEGRVKYVSARSAQILGYSPPDLVGRLAFDFMHPRQVEGVRAGFQQVVTLTRPLALPDFEWLRADDRWDWLAAEVYHWLEESGLTGFVLSVKSLTGSATLENSEPYHQLIENVRDVTLSVETQVAGRLTDRELNLLTLLTDKLTIEVEHAHPFVEVGQSEEKYRALVNSIKEVIFQISSAGKLQFLNPAWQEVMKYPIAETLGRDFTEFIYPDDLFVCQMVFQGLITGQVEDSRLGTRLVAKDGLVRWVEVFGRPIKRTTEAGKTEIVGIVGFLIDATRHKQAEADRVALERKMLEAQRLESLGILTGGIAHDFNNLLTTILGNAELAQLRLSELDDSPGWLTTAFQEIEAAGLYASELTRQMLVYSGKGQASYQTVSLNALVTELITLLKSSLLKQKTTLEIRFGDNLPQLQADLNQIRQVIMNLVVNASEAIGENSGLICLTTGQMWADQEHLAQSERWLGPGQSLSSGAYLFLEVSDNGCGMDEATQSHIFDPFYTTKFTGRGLGLAAVQGIVRGHKGALHIESQPGHGTTFRVLFPLPATNL